MNAEYKLSDPFIIIIGEADIEDLTALNSDLTRSKLIFACIDHNANALTSNYEINVFEIDEKDSVSKANMISPFNRDMTDNFKLVGKYESDKAISRIISMPFGGFVTFTSNKILYFSSDDFSKPFTTQGLFKDASKVLLVEFIDTMPDPASYDSGIFRTVIWTENGQLYLVVFNLKSLKDGDCFQFMNVSFQGRVSDLKCLAYISEGYFYCGTSCGNFTARLLNKHTGDPDSPYLQILSKNEECSAISHIEVVDKNEYDPKELVVVSSVAENYSVINLYRRGITLDVLMKEEFSNSQPRELSKDETLAKQTSRIGHMDCCKLGFGKEHDFLRKFEIFSIEFYWDLCLV